MRTYPPTIFNELDREWDHLLNTRRLDRALVRWRAVEEPLGPFSRVGDLLGLLEDQTADPEQQSEVLLALLRLAPTDEPAARLVLQRFVPALKCIAGWKQPMRQTDWAATVVSAAWEVIVTYPVDCRPARVAGNVVWEVRKRMYALLSEDRRAAAEVPIEELGDDDEVEPDVAERHEQADLLRWAAARSQLPDDVARLIMLTRVVGFEVEELAQQRGLPGARLRQRRWRCERRMREAIAAC